MKRIVRLSCFLFLCLISCSRGVSVESEWRQINRQDLSVLAPTVINQYAVRMEGTVAWVAWSGRSGDQSALQISSIDVSTNFEDGELYELRVPDGVVVGPELAFSDAGVELAWLLRRENGGRVLYDIQVCSLSAEGDFSSVETLEEGAGLQRLRLVETTAGTILVGTVVGMSRSFNEIRVYLRSAGVWVRCESGEGLSWRGDYPVFSPGEKSGVITWTSDGKLLVAQSTDYRTWSRAECEVAEGTVPQFVFSDVGGHWIATSSRIGGTDEHEIGLLRSGVDGVRWNTFGETLTVAGKQVAVPYGGIGSEGEVGLVLWWADSYPSCLRIEAAIYDEGWRRVPLNGGEESCFQSQLPVVAPVVGGSVVVWQEWLGGKGEMKLRMVKDAGVLWPEEWLGVHADTPEFACSAPRVSFSGDKGVLVGFQYNPPNGPRLKRIGRGNLVFRKLTLESDFGL